MSDETTAVEVETSPADETLQVKHAGRGKYKFNGVTYANKAEATAAKAEYELNQDEADHLEPLDPPEFAIRDRELVFRGDILEVPMNEPYLADGSYNPTFDRMWQYLWADNSARGRAEAQGKQYEPVRYKDIEALVKDGKCPPHYLNMREGDFIVSGDLILMKIYRKVWRQRVDAHTAHVQKLLKTGLRERAQEEADAAGVRQIGANNKFASLTLKEVSGL